MSAGIEHSSEVSTQILRSDRSILRHVRRVRSKYPLAPPSLEQDVYFPRTNIPRPIHKDYREHPEYFDKKKKDRKTS